jgi:hypothetical protein
VSQKSYLINISVYDDILSFIRPPKKRDAREERLFQIGLELVYGLQPVYSLVYGVPSAAGIRALPTIPASTAIVAI